METRGKRWLALGVASLALALLAPFAHAYPAHYFVVREAADGALSVVSHRRVELKGAPQSATQAAASSRLERALNATIHRKGTGDPTFAARSVASPFLRGEFHAKDGSNRIDGHHLAAETREYVVRVPAQANATLRLQGEAGPGGRPAPPLVLDLDAYEMQAKDAAPPTAGTAMGTRFASGDSSNRLDILVVAEGYVAGQQDQFVADMGRVMDQFFAISPYADFRHLVNVTWLFVPSNQAGADKPSCAETPGSPLVFVDTAFDASYCTSGIRRLLTVNASKVFTAAAAVPDWDKIMVIVNDTEYGGSGGSLSVTSIASQSPDIMRHEFGHSFSLLADEYDTPFPGYPACSDIGGSSPCEANVTDQSDRNLLKWRGWVAAGTPIPTSGPLTDPLAAGLWQGARYVASGMFRQCYNGLMRSLGVAFCDVDSEAFVKRLYGGGWGAPATGVSLIEPGSTPAAVSIDAAQGTSVAFQAAIAGSLDGLTATWRVDGATVQTQPTTHGAIQSFNFVVPDTGSHTIELQVVDNTTFTLQRPTASRQWTVRGTPAAGVPGAPTIYGAAAGNAQATLSFSPPSSDGGSPITSYTASCTPGPVTATGSASPITVTGLANGTTYSCTVRATNANGSGPASGTVNVTPSAATSPAMTAVKSRKIHGAAGVFELPLDAAQPIGGAVTVEARKSGGAYLIVFQFNVAITAAGTASVVDASSAPLGSASTAASGNEVIVTLTGIPDNRRANVTLTGVNGSGATFSAPLGILPGDVDSSRSVSASDVGMVKQRSGESVQPANFIFDLDASGAVTATDILLAKGRTGATLP